MNKMAIHTNVIFRPRNAMFFTAAGFISQYLNSPLPYVQRHITVNKMC